MQSKLNPYINFKDTAREAIEFYKNVFGGKVTISTFKDGGAPVGPDFEDKVMHAMLIADNGMTLMVSDAPPGIPLDTGSNISISLSGDNEKELRVYWGKLSSGGKITVALDKAPWGDTFGMLTDKFGVGWLVNISAKK